VSDHHLTPSRRIFLRELGGVLSSMAWPASLAQQIELPALGFSKKGQTDFDMEHYAQVYDRNDCLRLSVVVIGFTVEDAREAKEYASALGPKLGTISSSKW